MALDPDYARMLWDRKKEIEESESDEDEEDDSEEGWKPETRSQEGFTPIISTMYSMLETLQEIPRTLIAVNGRKPPQQRKIPRPVSALDVLELEDERDEMHDLAARFGMKRSG